MSALAATTLLTGCNQVMLLGYLIGGPPSIEPDFDAETGLSLDLPDVTVAVVCYAPSDLKMEQPKLDTEVATHVAYRLAQNNIQVVNPDRIHAWIDEHPDWDHPEEIGEAFNADYVIEIELATFGLYEHNSTELLRGRTETHVNVFEMDEFGRGDRIYTNVIDNEYPTEVPRSIYEQSVTAFRAEYLSQLSQAIGWMFYPRYSGDKVGWAT
ncbi:MAG: hypothetical protein DWQ34_15215 [Planctomycetota bacterium]|nr:MAG: hypothetical protein DWQ29_08995 [Planctomycetota bacterium]REJ91300.1 MAG: hypothetical protein DWQ34_15215 [Planctomycetota bacterium]REK31279.1 MAG: hypothetical protein DWQ41_00020 [Planctomycetota bacterium]REK37309.1 MAG: hypothetical protein DWQ45_07625 [Planctomycetota bacterium]